MEDAVHVHSEKDDCLKTEHVSVTQVYATQNN